MLWPLFGSTNQLLAGVTLLIVSIWLKRQGRPTIYTFLPMLLVATTTILAMVDELGGHLGAGNWLLVTLGGVILACNIWVLFEGLQIYRSTPAEGTV